MLGNNSFKIKDRIISSNTPPLIIAEIGINHGGSLDKAKKMVSAAAASGCECVKHQTHIIEDEMTDEAKKIIPPNANVSIWDIMQECCLSKSEELELKEFSESLGLIWISTPFSRAAADFLDEINTPAFKIGSGEADNLPLIRHIASKGKPVIMSTGMQSIETITPAVNILKNANIEFALLECTNLYPSPPEIVSLRGILDLKHHFPDVCIGFSDHSIGPEMALASAALGAVIIERHFTDSRYNIGPDISCSMDPIELKYLIEKSKEIHIALNNNKERTKQEESVYLFARGSIVADKDLIAGTELTSSDIWSRRPGNGEIPAYEFDNLLGRKINKNIKYNQQLKWSDFD